MREGSLDRTHKEYAEAKRAEKLMSDTLLMQALEEIEQDLFKEFMRTKWFQSRKRECLHKQMKMPNWFREKLFSKMRSIELLEKRLEANNDRKQLRTNRN